MNTGGDTQTIAIITARSASTRLPDKVLSDICGKPMLQHIVDSAQRADVDNVVVATVEGDDKIINFCRENKISFYAGSEDDILGRLYHAASWWKAGIIVRLWGDCPLVSTERINATIEMHRTSPLAYNYTVSSDYTGVIAVTPFSVLKDAWANLHNYDSRHWIHTYLSKQNILSVDTQADLDVIRKLWVKLGR